jgi:tRNA threonylcarbamoyladenosine biosynthesis protein TsaE
LPIVLKDKELKTIDFTYHLKDIDQIALNVLENLQSKTILLDGAMGAGKTTFINALLKVMGSNDIATSPTFSIVNEYRVLDDKIYHFDFYRIESEEEAYNFGIEDYFNTNNWLFIEWAERIKNILPNNTQTITLTTIEDDKRALKLTINKENLTKYNAMTEPKF